MFHIILDNEASAAIAIAVFWHKGLRTGAIRTQAPSNRAIGSDKLICGSQSYD